MNTPPPLAQPKSSGGGCLKAAGIGCLVILIGLGVLGYVGYRFVKHQYTAVMERYEREGYKKVEGQMIEVPDRVTEPTIYVGQSVKIMKGSERGMAFLCQTAEIHGDVVGNVHFVGQMLTIKEDAELMRDLEVTAQLVNLFGKVDGKVTGVYQMLNKDPKAIPALK
jgi:hypothetical protein